MIPLPGSREGIPLIEKGRDAQVYMDSYGSREETLAAFKKGQIDILVNVAMLREGFDNPNIRVVQIARPTTSRLLYEQMIGRGTRPLNSKNPKDHSRKPNFVVLDMTTNIEDHVIGLDRMDLARLFGEEYISDIYVPIVTQGGEGLIPLGEVPQGRVLGYWICPQLNGHCFL